MERLFENKMFPDEKELFKNKVMKFVGDQECIIDMLKKDYIPIIVSQEIIIYASEIIKNALDAEYDFAKLSKGKFIANCKIIKEILRIYTIEIDALKKIKNGLDPYNFMGLDANTDLFKIIAEHPISKGYIDQNVDVFKSGFVFDKPQIFAIGKVDFSDDEISRLLKMNSETHHILKMIRYSLTKRSKPFFDDKFYECLLRQKV